MTAVSTSSPDDNDNENPAPTPILINQTTHLLKTQTQCGVLLAVLEKCGYFVMSDPSSGQEFSSKTPEFDESELAARKAASSTYEAACFQLRNLIDDPSRWQLADDETEKRTGEIVAASLKSEKARAEGLGQLIRPCRMFATNCRYVSSVGRWAAWHGSDLSSFSVHGLGDSQREAMEAFDTAYGEHLDVTRAVHAQKEADRVAREAAEAKAAAEQTPPVKPGQKRRTPRKTSDT